MSIDGEAPRPDFDFSDDDEFVAWAAERGIDVYSEEEREARDGFGDLYVEFQAASGDLWAARAVRERKPR